MKQSLLFALAVILVLGSTSAMGQIAGSLTVTEMKDMAYGWSVKKTILNQAVYNENKEKVGTVHDLIIAPDTSVSYVIIGTGGFVGLGKHDVAIPVAQVQEQGGKLILPGATKTAVKALPPFEYAPQHRMANAVHETRESYERWVQSELEKMDHNTKTLKQDAQAKSAEVKVQVEKALAELQLKRDVATQKFTEFQRASSEAWTELRIGMDKALVDLKHAYAEAKSKLA